MYLLCLKKCFTQLTAFQTYQICQLYKTKINISNSRVLQGLCESCRTTLRRKQEGEEVALPTLFNFKSIQLRIEAKGTTCYWLICPIGRLKLQEKHPLEKQTIIEKEPSVSCSTCLSSSGKGLPHQCSQIKYRKNLQFLATKDAKAAENFRKYIFDKIQISLKK